MSESSETDEFAGIEPAPARRSPILALSIIGVCLFTVFHIRHEMSYSLSSRQPVPLEELRATGLPYLDRYVSVHGVPERRNSLYIEPRDQRDRESFFRLLDADPPIFVRARDTTGHVDLPAAWSGRLRRFSDVSYASSLRDYFSKAAEVDHYLDLASVHAAMAAPGTAIVDRVGRPVTLSVTDVLYVEAVPHDYALEMPRDKFPTQADAQHELERVLAKLDVKIRPLDASPDAFRFATPMLEGDQTKRAALFATLTDADIDFLPDVRVYEATRDGLRLEHDVIVGQQVGQSDSHDVLVVALKRGSERVDWREVRSISFREPLQVSDQALVLNEGESPQGFLWAPLVAALLLALAAFNVWYLVRPRRAA